MISMLKVSAVVNQHDVYKLKAQVGVCSFSYNCMSPQREDYPGNLT